MMGFGRMAATLQEQLSLDFGYGNMIHEDEHSLPLDSELTVGQEGLANRESGPVSPCDGNGKTASVVGINPNDDTNPKIDINFEWCMLSNTVHTPTTPPFALLSLFLSQCTK